MRLKQLKQLKGLMESQQKSKRSLFLLFILLTFVELEIITFSKDIVFAGDFNALRRSDYNDTQWAKIIAHDKDRDVSTEKKAIDFVEGQMLFQG
jgi:hypothetical protein